MRLSFLCATATSALFFGVVSAKAAEKLIPISGSSTSSAPVFHEIETGYIFGFVAGSDIGAQGERELESETNAKFKKRDGSYRAVGQELAYEFVPTQFLQVELSARGNYNYIKNVTGEDNINRLNFSGLGSKFKYLAIGRGPGSPVGLAFSAEPSWSRIDDGSGKRTNSYATEFRAVADTELVKNRLYLALNAIYEPGISKERGATSTSRSSNIGLSTALAYRVTQQVTLGAALEYFRSYEGLAFKKFEGQAVYVGPTLHVKLTKKIYVAAALEAQVFGREAHASNSLDLTHFERYRARLKFGVEF